jgi:hypothetical protein
VLSFKPVSAPNSFFVALSGGAEAHSRPVQHDVHEPKLRVSNSAFGLPSALQASPPGTYRLDVLYAGQPRVSPAIVQRHATLLHGALLRYVARRIADTLPLCSQWVNHLGVSPTLAALRESKVLHSMCVQLPGDVVLLAPGAYFQVFDTGACVSESMCWGNGASALRAADYKRCRAPCRE